MTKLKTSLIVKIHSINQTLLYRKDTEPFYHAFMYSILLLLSGIYPFTQWHSLLITIICYRELSTKVFISLTVARPFFIITFMYFSLISWASSSSSSFPFVKMQTILKCRKRWFWLANGIQSTCLPVEIHNTYCFLLVVILFWLDSNSHLLSVHICLSSILSLSGQTEHAKSGIKTFFPNFCH